ncbi:MAG: non-heme iron oxygenase ferredoxin subunit [Chloroflexi bacterium]|nr:non-heme iron oxygenase ferredoxin subunit [Chloroflexota bacterium]
MAEPQFFTVARVGEVAPDTVRVVYVGPRRLALCHVDGEYYAIDDICTHDGGPLGEGELFDCEIECPRHGARFDVRTGAVRALPAVFPVATYPVKIAGDEIQVGVPMESAQR